MKVKALPYNERSLSQKHFFILMIVPLLLGLIITLTNFAYADWTQEDPILNVSPTKQGWKQIQVYQKTSNHKFNKKS